MNTNDDGVNTIPLSVNSKPDRTPATFSRCLYCGKIGGPWWECLCVKAIEVREGKRAKPKIVHRGAQTIIVMDDETVAANPLGLPRFQPQPAELATVSEIAADQANFSTVTIDRKEYRREWMRQRRKRLREAPK